MVVLKVRPLELAALRPDLRWIFVRIRSRAVVGVTGRPGIRRPAPREASSAGAARK
jgi:hypothetical protein